VVHFDGHPLFIGRSDGSVAVTTSLGNSTGPHLLVGEEGGRLVFYDRAHLSCRTYRRFPKPKRALPGMPTSEPMSRRDIERYLQPERESEAAEALDVSLVPELLVEGGSGGEAFPGVTLPSQVVSPRSLLLVAAVVGSMAGLLFTLRNSLHLPRALRFSRQNMRTQ